jgi:hypothetical protein
VSALVAHGGTTGIAIEAALAVLILAIGVAAWLGARKDQP